MRVIVVFVLVMYCILHTCFNYINIAYEEIEESNSMICVP